MGCNELNVCVRFGGDQPVYINIIRDPVNRFLSNYFFRRFGDWRGEQNHMIRTPSMRQEERYLVSQSCCMQKVVSPLPGEWPLYQGRLTLPFPGLALGASMERGAERVLLQEGGLGERNWFRVTQILMNISSNDLLM